MWAAGGWRRKEKVFSIIFIFKKEKCVFSFLLRRAVYPEGIFPTTFTSKVSLKLNFHEITVEMMTCEADII